VSDLQAAVNYIFMRTRKVFEGLQKRYKAMIGHALERGSMTLQMKIVDWINKDYPEDGDDPDLEVIKFLWKQHNLLRDFENPPVTILGMRRRYREVQTATRPLLQILATVFVENKAESTNPKDRIYAMLGMAEDNEALRLTPNYDETVSYHTVYTEAARAMIIAGHVDLLSYSQHPSHQLSVSWEGTQLPSWVPDWDRLNTRPSGRAPWETAFKVSGDRLFRQVSDHGHCPEQIKLQGWAVDTIQEISMAWIRPDASSTKDKDAINAFWSDVAIFCRTSNNKLSYTGREIYSCPYDRESANFRIPIADQERNNMGFVHRAARFSKAVPETLISEEINEAMERTMYLQDMKDQCYRRPFLSLWGYVGLAPNTAERGDLLVIFCGAKFPYVCRKKCDGTYKLVGEAYVHGIMYGEFVEDPPEVKEFILQ
jgi:hypothetical protein